MNYNTSFGFSDSPFLDIKDQRFLFLSKKHEKLLSELLGFVTARQGIAVISGDEGVGKTTLVQALIERLPQSFQPLVITKPAAEPLAIALLIAQSLGINLGERNLANLTLLSHVVQAAAQQQKYFLVILDDAHVLTDQNLEEIYILSQMEYQGQQLMPIILVGRKGLIQKLASKANQRLQELIRKNLPLASLTFSETTSYIDHRLQQVGSSFKTCFAEGCSGQIFSRTSGIPRRINQVCDQALTHALQENRSRVTRDLLGLEESTTSYKPLVTLPPSKWRFLKGYGTLMGVVLLAGLAGYFIYNNYYKPSPQTSSSVAETITPSANSPLALPQQKSPPEPLTVSQAQPRDQAEGKDDGQQELKPSVFEDSQEPERAQELTVATVSQVPPPGVQGPEAVSSTPAIYEVAPQDGLLRIVASHYPYDKEIGYDAIILANSRISNEDIIYPGQKLSLPKIDKSNNVITLNKNEHFCIFKHFYNSSQVEKAASKLKELQVRYLIRETVLPDNVTVYRIFLGSYENLEELKEAMASAEKN